MAVPRPHDTLHEYDPSRKAAAQLDAILETQPSPEDLLILNPLPQSSKKEKSAAQPIETPSRASVDEVRRGARLIEGPTDRSSVRLLIVTKNAAVRALGSASQKRLVELSRVFNEIHVVILNQFTEATVSTVRLTDNVWLYSTDSDAWWKMGFDAYRMANEELIFTNTFRADIIVSEDPFESGVVGYALARKYKRPFEVHVLEDIYSEEFEETDPHHTLHSFMAPFVLKHANSVRVKNESLQEEITHAFPQLAPYTEVLPRYYNLNAWKDSIPMFSLRERYPQFNFIILHISNMQSASHTKEVIMGVAPLLRAYPTIGLVVVGNGPHRSALEKQVIALGIQAQVEFEPIPDEIISHMKSAQLLIHLSEDPAEDTTLLQAAAVGLPILGRVSVFTTTILVDNESAYLCPQIDPACVSYKLKLFLNDTLARLSFAEKAQESVFSRIEQDYDAYLRAYRSSVERCAIWTTEVA